MRHRNYNNNYNYATNNIDSVADPYYNNGNLPEAYYNEAEVLGEQYNNCCGNVPTHVHEYSESVKLAEQGNERHNHRASGVTGEPIPIKGGRSHVHKIDDDNTDSLDHYHKICVTTGPAIPIPGTNKHVHLVCGTTTTNDGHCHKFLFTTDIENPLV